MLQNGWDDVTILYKNAGGPHRQCAVIHIGDGMPPPPLEEPITPVVSLDCEGTSHHNEEANDDAGQHQPAQTRDPSDELD